MLHVMSVCRGEERRADPAIRALHGKRSGQTKFGPFFRIASSWNLALAL